MDLVLKGASGDDIMVISPDAADFSWGDGDNDFELTFEDGARAPEMPKCGFVYAHGTEYGGMLTRARASDGSVKWSGPTWTGLLAGKVLVPDAGQSRLTVSGEANAVLDKLIDRMGLGDAMAAASEPSGIDISRYAFDLYADGYTGILAMLASVGAKLRVRHDGRRAVLSALPVRDWSSDEGFDSSLVEVDVDVDSWCVNHLVARGGEEGKDRIAVELYMDESGCVSERQTLKGVREHSEYYNYTTADRSKLVEDGTKRLRDYFDKAMTVSVRLSADDDRFDIGDKVGGSDPRTGISATATVSSKVLTVDAYGAARVSYETT